MNEAWRPVPDFDGLYEVSNLGRVRSLSRVVAMRDGRTKPVTGRILQQSRCDGGRLKVSLWRENVGYNRVVSRLVARAFLGEPASPDLEACHDDGDQDNNNVSNLRWDTRIGNEADKTRHGTRLIGERHTLAKLTEADVVEIRRSPECPEVLAGKFGVHPMHVNRIRRYERWKHVA